MRWRFCTVAAVIVLGGCGFVDEPPRAATSTPVRLAVARVPTSSPPTSTIGQTPTRAVPTRTPTPEPADDSAIEQSVADARASFERVFRNAALPGLESILVETVALAAPTGGEQLERAAAARWLRQRATGRIRIIEFQRHQHQALVLATTQGWAAMAPLTEGGLGFTLRRYDASGAQDPDHGDWLIDVIEAE
jgi:hypothetical protein